MKPPSATIKISVDGGEATIKMAEAIVRRSVKSRDPIERVGRSIIIKMTEREAVRNIDKIAYRLKRALSDLDCDIDVSD